MKAPNSGFHTLLRPETNWLWQYSLVLDVSLQPVDRLSELFS